MTSRQRWILWPPTSQTIIKIKHLMVSIKGYSMKINNNRSNTPVIKTHQYLVVFEWIIDNNCALEIQFRFSSGFLQTTMRIQKKTLGWYKVPVHATQLFVFMLQLCAFVDFNGFCHWMLLSSVGLIFSCNQKLFEMLLNHFGLDWIG